MFISCGNGLTETTCRRNLGTVVQSAKCKDYKKETFWRNNSSIREYLKKSLIQLKEDYVQVSYISTTRVFKIKAALKACD